MLIATVLAACASPPPESPTPTITSTSVTPSPVPANADGTYRRDAGPQRHLELQRDVRRGHAERNNRTTP